MPDPNVDALNATTYKEIYPRVLRDLFFKSMPTLAYLRSKVVPFEGGVSMDHTFSYDALIGGSYQKGESFNLFKPEILAALSFLPKFYYTNVSEYLEDVEVFNKGPLAVFSRVDADMETAMKTINSIVGIALWHHGQAAGGAVVNNRAKDVNGFEEAINNGVDPSWRGNVFVNYGGQVRNGVVGGTINGNVRWCGDAAGNPGPITYPVLEESYQDCVRGSLEPDLITSNKKVHAFIKERIQAAQRFQQERDPIYGVMSFKFNNAFVLKDDYFPSAVSAFGVNDPKLGDYSTGTFTTPATVTPKSKLPASTLVTVGEPILMLHSDAWQFRISNSKLFGFGFTGFKHAQDNLKVAGQILAACNLQGLDNGLNLWLYGIDK